MCELRYTRNKPVRILYKVAKYHNMHIISLIWVGFSTLRKSMFEKAWVVSSLTVIDIRNTTPKCMHISALLLFVYAMRITMDSMTITRMNIPGGKNGVFRLESVDCTVIQTQSYNSYTFTSLHNEIQCKIFHKIHVVSNYVSKPQITLFLPAIITSFSHTCHSWPQ